MSTNTTHHSRLARSLQHATGLAYTTALARVRLAHQAGLLPRRLDDTGMARALDVLCALDTLTDRTPTHQGPQRITIPADQLGGPDWATRPIAGPIVIVGEDRRLRNRAAAERAAGHLSDSSGVIVIDAIGGDTVTALLEHRGISATTSSTLTPGDGLDLFAGLDSDTATRVVAAVHHFNDQHWQHQVEGVARTIVRTAEDVAGNEPFTLRLAANLADDPDTLTRSHLAPRRRDSWPGDNADTAKTLAGFNARLWALTGTDAYANLCDPHPQLAAIPETHPGRPAVRSISGDWRVGGLLDVVITAVCEQLLTYRANTGTTPHLVVLGDGVADACHPDTVARLHDTTGENLIVTGGGAANTSANRFGVGTTATIDDTP